jgi:membrane protease YdiL (CAAX protease family)
MSAPFAPDELVTDDRLGPRTRAEAWRWLGAAVLGFLVGTVCGVALSAIGAAIAGVPGGLAAAAKEPVPPVWFICCGLVGLWIGFGGATYLVTRSGRGVGLSIRPSDAWYLFLGIGLQILIAFLYLPFHLKGLDKPVHHLLGAGSGWVLVIPGVMAVLFAPFFEELFFRGVILRGFLTIFATRLAVIGVTLAVLADGALFGLAHLGNDQWVQLPGLTCVGVVLAVLAVRTRRLGPSIVTHVAFNSLAVLAFAVRR